MKAEKFQFEDNVVNRFYALNRTKLSIYLFTV